MSMSPIDLLASWEQGPSRGTNAEVGDDIGSAFGVAIELDVRSVRDLRAVVPALTRTLRIPFTAKEPWRGGVLLYC